VRGSFITFEGPEGSGKTTQAARLADRLRAEGLTVLQTREPGGTRTGEAIRNILQHDAAGEPLCAQAEVLLFAASRAQLVQHVILPALERGTWVISDRFADSTTAYQGYGRGFGPETMLAINAFAVGVAQPDMTLLLDLEIETGMRRMEERNAAGNRGRDRIEREDLAFHRRVRDGYLELAARWPERFRVINSTPHPDEVHELIWQTVSPLRTWAEAGRQQ
jgi:dTMP kinase